MKADAITALEQLLSDKISVDRLDQVHDTLKLLGIVLGQFALLEIVVDKDADEKARVSAARALLSVDESPDKIAERLRSSSFSDLSIEQLEAMIHKVKSGESNLSDLLIQLGHSDAPKT